MKEKAIKEKLPQVLTQLDTKALANGILINMTSEILNRLPKNTH